MSDLGKAELRGGLILNVSNPPVINATQGNATSCRAYTADYTGTLIIIIKCDQQNLLTADK